MQRTLFMFLAVAVFAGCASTSANTPPPAQPAPEAAPAPEDPALATSAPEADPEPQPPAETPTRLAANLPPGWQATQFPGGAFGVVNQDAGAQIVFAVLPAAEIGPRDAIERLRAQVAQEPGATSEEVQTTPDGDIHTWRYTREVDGVGTVQGTVMARPSNMDGYALMAMAMWPADQDERLLGEFAMIASTLRLE